MADQVMEKNLFLINAPAGSGKTTTIKRMIRDRISEGPLTNILCVTFTNRATDGLIEENFPGCVEISTIHSFISRFMSIYFGHSSILALYFEVYRDAIIERITNSKNDERITASNEKYMEKYGKLDLDTVRKNVNQLYYNELEFNSLYTGGLCHNDLLCFTKMAIERHPILRKRINEKYRYVFIDEYQDTSSDVLNIFYDAIKNTTAKLYLFGDKMQQIYKNYGGEFEEELTDFDLSSKLRINYRSTKSIIDILNRIYNDKDYHQEPSDENKKIENPAMPIVVFSENIEVDIQQYEAPQVDSLVLYIANRKRFKKIGAASLYDAVSRMERYQHVKKYSVVDVLTQNSKDNPDGLFELLFFLFELKKNFDNRKYGSVLQLIKHHKMFDKYALSINSHTDKKVFYEKLKDGMDLLDGEKEIREILIHLCDSSVLVRENIEYYFSDEDYENVLGVSIKELKNLLSYLNDPHASTQHGVKGESHNSIIFVAEDSGNPSVKMYGFFELWTKMDITLTEFEKSYFSICRAIDEILGALDLKSKDEINQSIYSVYKSHFDQALKQLDIQSKDNVYFMHIYQPHIQAYFDRPGVGKLKACLNKNLIYGIYVAYKLFYVGCSRARKNLTVIINKSNIASFEDALYEKFKSIGFEIHNKI